MLHTNLPASRLPIIPLSSCIHLSILPHDSPSNHPLINILLFLLVLLLPPPVGGTLSRHSSLPTHRQQLPSKAPLCSSLSSTPQTVDSYPLYTPPTHVVLPLPNGLSASTGTHTHSLFFSNFSNFNTRLFKNTPSESQHILVLVSCHRSCFTQSVN